MSVKFSRSNGRYILRGKDPVEEPDLMKWAEWFENIDNHRVAQTEVAGMWVSTVFLGLDPQHGTGEPLLFETMCFENGEAQSCERYATWEMAETGHAKIVEWIRANR